MINKKFQDIDPSFKSVYDYISANEKGSVEYSFAGEDKIMTFDRLSNGSIVALCVDKKVVFKFLDTLVKMFFIIGLAMIVLSALVSGEV